MNKRILSITFILAILAVGMGGGFIIGKSNAPGEGISGIQEFTNVSRIFSKKPSIALIEEGISIIEKKYVGRSDISRDDLYYGAMKGLLESLDDPYSVYLKPDVSKTFEEDVSGKFEGIGAEIGIRDNMLTVISPLKGNPAERAGLKAGDKILYVDDTDTGNLALDDAVRIIRGPKGSVVVLTISREKATENIKISITRDTIKIPIITWEEKERDTAYIEFSQFTETSTNSFENIAQEILRSGSKRIVLDLRNNPGGYLDAAVNIAGWFLEPDSVAVIEDTGEGIKNREFKTSGPASLKDFPLVVIVNKGSASAAEILAGALRDHRSVTLLGETTFGKGSVQELVHLADGSSIKITISKWLTPSGLSIQDNGLVPDIEVEMSADIFDAKGDVQLDRAIDVVRSL